MVILGEYLTVSEMIAVEMNSEYLGVSTQMLMETAGKSVADETTKRLKPGSRIVIASGLSGNGGDGFVAAETLRTSLWRTHASTMRQSGK